MTTTEIAFASVGDGRTVECSPQPSGTWYPWDDAGSRVKFPDCAADCLHGAGGVIVGPGAGGAPELATMPISAST